MPSTNIGYVVLEDMYSPAATPKIVKEHGNHPVAEACLQEAEEENRNGRCYLTEDLTREQQCKRTLELLQTGYMCGEAGHPTDTSIIRQQTIDPRNTAVRYLKFWMDGPKWMAHYCGCNNDVGRAIEQDLLEGWLPAFSMRSLGTLESVNGRNVVRDLRYITHDFVIFPSHPGAYTHRLVNEATIAKKESKFNKLIKDRKQKIMTESTVIPVTNDEVISYIKEQSRNIKSVLDQIDCFYESAIYDNKRNSVILKAKSGDTFVVNCESFIRNEIESYCNNLYNGAI